MTYILIQGSGCKDSCLYHYFMETKLLREEIRIYIKSWLELKLISGAHRAYGCMCLIRLHYYHYYLQAADQLAMYMSRPTIILYTPSTNMDISSKHARLQWQRSWAVPIHA